MHQKTCGNPDCLTEFSTCFPRQKYCSISCANSGTTVRTDEQVRAYFLSHVTGPYLPDKCWIWQGGISEKGYGIACVRNTVLRAHRLSYELFVGPIPRNLDILHSEKCHTRACVNPLHLRCGTNAENAKDRVNFGMQPRGSEHYNARLTEENVTDILHLFHDDGMQMKEIAQHFRVNIVTIHDIVHRKSWTHILPDLYPAPERDSRATLMKEDVRTIRQMHTDGTTYHAIARQFCVTIGQVQRICTRPAWKHVE